MKTKIYSVIALLFLSLSVSAQIDRTKIPVSGPAPKINIGTPEKFTLPNGLQVLVVENHKLPRVSVTLDIDNPPVTKGNKKGVEAFVGGLLGTGSTTISKEDFDKEVDYLGASIGFGSEGASASSLSKYFPKVLELMADAAFNPVFSQEEFDKQMKQALDGIKNSEKSVTAIANRVDRLLTFGKNHPFGEFISEKTLKNITLQDVKDYYNTFFKPNNAYLVIIGDVDFNTVKKQITTLFSGWEKGTIKTQPLPKVTNPSTTEINFIDMPNAVQSEVAIINTVDLKPNDKDYYAVILVNQILGGSGTGRLYKNLREDKAYTYGAGSGINASKYVGRFKASASVRNMVTDSTVVEFMKEINTIRYQKATQEELDIAKAKYVGSFVTNVESPTTIANYALSILQNNLPEDYYEKYLENINAVTLEDAQDAAIKYFRGDKARIVITGKGADVLTNLEKGNYIIKYFDKEGNSTKKPEMTKSIPAGVTKETVINNYFKAIGGIDKIKTVKTTLVTYEASAGGQTIQTSEKRDANNFLNEVSMGGNIMMKVLTTKDGVSTNGQSLPANIASEMTYNLGVFPEFGLLNNSDTKLISIENLDGKDAYVIAKKGEVVSVSTYFDIETGLKVKEVQSISMGGQSQIQETTFGNYKDFNGIKFPTKKSGVMGPQKLESTIISVKINEGVTEADFK